MKTVFLGICEINTRRHFVGLWPTLAALKKELEVGYDIFDAESRYNYSAGPEYKPVKVYDAVYNNVDRDTIPDDFPGFLGSDCDGFVIYEIDVDNLPGYLSFDED